MKPKCIKILLFTFFIFYLNNSCLAGGEITTTGSRQAGMGRVSVAITDFWNVQNNQAGIALMDKISAGLYYESRFTINQLSSKSVAVVVPTGIGVIGATFNYFGYSLYNEMKIGLVYARSFGQYFRMGVQLDYLQTSLGNDYGNKGNITFEISVQSDVTENLTLGAWVYNPIRVRLADYDDERIPAIFRFGIAWHFSDHFFATVEAEKNTNFRPIIVRGGLEYVLKTVSFCGQVFRPARKFSRWALVLKLRFYVSIFRQ